MIYKKKRGKNKNKKKREKAGSVGECSREGSRVANAGWQVV